MKYRDRVYGEFNITEPIILELIKTPSLQRLKGIDQAGYRSLWVNPEVSVGEYDHTRFAHSMGVYLLLFQYGASIEEQIAGLIHDVSHSAFSHCIDYVLKVGSEKEQSHQDNFFDCYIRQTKIPEIIKKFGFDLEYILNDENFPLKEKELPDLCADRIDYSLKTAVISGEIDKKEKNYFLENLTTKNNNWVFKNFKSAKKYAELFSKLNTVYYSGLPSAAMFRTVGDYLKYSLDKKYIFKKDLYETDKIVIDKIKKYLNKDKKLKLLWKRMNGEIKIANNSKDYDAKVFCKSRIVDPLFMEKDEIKKLSKIESDWSETIKKELIPKEYFLKFEK